MPRKSPHQPAPLPLPSCLASELALGAGPGGVWSDPHAAGSWQGHRGHAAGARQPGPGAAAQCPAHRAHGTTGAQLVAHDPQQARQRAGCAPRGSPAGRCSPIQVRACMQVVWVCCCAPERCAAKLRLDAGRLSHPSGGAFWQAMGLVWIIRCAASGKPPGTCTNARTSQLDKKL